jgi:hypothetical protein
MLTLVFEKKSQKNAIVTATPCFSTGGNFKDIFPLKTVAENLLSIAKKCHQSDCAKSRPRVSGFTRYIHGFNFLCPDLKPTCLQTFDETCAKIHILVPNLNEAFYVLGYKKL